ncbi:MAG: hypothetical protein WKF42_07810 [Solirubrobacteraceae bacterium]
MARSLVLTGAATLVVFGLVIDLDMVWLTVLVILGASAVGSTKSVKLRATRSSRGWAAALAATFFLALLADIAVQFLARGADLPLPNTLGATAAALTVIAVCRPVQTRMAASLRP